MCDYDHYSSVLVLLILIMYTQPVSVTLPGAWELSVILYQVNVSVNQMLLEESATLAWKDFT